MNLRDWLHFNRKTVTEFAKELGITRTHLNRLVNESEKHQPSPQLAIKIEKATDGQVSRKELRPDIFGD